MIQDTLQRRDLEILRTLVRLRYMTTQDIVAGFFTNPWVGRRRLQKLSGLDLIASHRKGVPDVLRYYAWRLTTRGVDAVAEAFPDEPIPEELSERLADGSLYNADHRAALTRLYLKLLAVRAGRMPDNADAARVKMVVDALRERAGQYWWQPDGDVVLRFDRLGQAVQVVPDATVCSRQKTVRVFIELDRSTHGLARVKDAIERYARFFSDAYAESFHDAREPVLLFVTRTAARQASIQDLCGQTFHSTARWAVVLDVEAAPWLDDALFDPAPATDSVPATSRGPSSGLIHVASELYHWAHEYRRALNANGDTFPPEGDALLQKLRRELRSLGRDQHAE